MSNENNVAEMSASAATEKATPLGKGGIEKTAESEWQLLMYLQKQSGDDAWRGKLEFSHTAAVIKGLAIMIQQCASDLDVPVGAVVARLATVLLAPQEEKEADHHNGGAASQ